MRVSVNGAVVLEGPVGQLRALWEETSFQLDRLQAEPRYVAEEEQGLRERMGPTYCLPPGFPSAGVPREPGEGACAEAWAGVGAGRAPLPWSRVWGVEVGKEPSGSETLLLHPPRWSRSPGCRLARGGQ